MTVLRVGISSNINQAIQPNIIVPIPKPINLKFQVKPKCSYDHFVAYQKAKPNGAPINNTNVFELTQAGAFFKN